jgi:hypothetical protein
MLVFSKTSFQGPKISPKKPRGLYFNDHVAVGFVQDGDVIELISVDPMQGVMFEVDPIVWTKIRQSLDGAAG